MSQASLFHQYDRLTDACNDADAGIPTTLSLRSYITVGYGDQTASLLVSNDSSRSYLALAESDNSPPILNVLYPHAPEPPNEEDSPAISRRTPTIDISVLPQTASNAAGIDLAVPSIDIIGNNLINSSDEGAYELGKTLRNFAKLEPQATQHTSRGINCRYDTEAEPSQDLMRDIRDYTTEPTVTEMTHPTLYCWGGDRAGGFMVEIQQKTGESRGQPFRHAMFYAETTDTSLAVGVMDREDIVYAHRKERQQPTYPQLLDPSIPMTKDIAHMALLSHCDSIPEHPENPRSGVIAISNLLARVTGVTTDRLQMFT